MGNNKNDNLSGASHIIRSRFDAINDVGTYFGDESLTLQSELESTDVHRIVARHAETGLWSDNLAPSTREPFYGDFSEPCDLLTAETRLVQAKASFMTLPSDVRAEFGNNPLLMLQALAIPENREKFEKLGLLKKSEHAPLDVNVPTDTLQGQSLKKVGEEQ